MSDLPLRFNSLAKDVELYILKFNGHMIKNDRLDLRIDIKKDTLDEIKVKVKAAQPIQDFYKENSRKEPQNTLHRESFKTLVEARTVIGFKLLEEKAAQAPAAQSQAASAAVAPKSENESAEKKPSGLRP